MLALIRTGLVIRNFFGDRNAHHNDRPRFLPYRILVDLGGFVNGFFSFVGRYSVVDKMIRGREGTDAADETVAFINNTVIFALIAWIIFIILSIELIIPWNHISGVYSFDSGQWIVLVASACSLVRVLWIWQKLEFKPKDE